MKRNKCHPFNSRRGRLKGTKKYIYNMGSKLDMFLRKRCFLLCFFFTSYCLYNAKKFASVGISYKNVILFSKIFYTLDIVYVK